MRDVVADEVILASVQGEAVFIDSLLRTVSLSVIHGQFKRVLVGEVALSDFHFLYRQEENQRHAGIKLNFKVTAASKPSTNVHVLIGRNGVGKTTLLKTWSMPWSA
jgi:ABC-type uncharacterized transport system ATPase subunit